MRPLIFLILAMVAQLYSFSQNAHYKDSIEMVKRPLGAIDFYQHDRKLTNPEVLTTMSTNQEAFRYFKKAKNQNVVATILGAAGGFLIGFELGYAVGGKDINPGVLATGIGLVGISIPFGIRSKKNATRAVYLYNAAFR